jgi:hypothetical protein
LVVFIVPRERRVGEPTTDIRQHLSDRSDFVYLHKKIANVMGHSRVIPKRHAIGFHINDAPPRQPTVVHFFIPVILHRLG